MSEPDGERITWWAQFKDAISAPAQVAARSVDKLGDESKETAAELALLEKQAKRTGHQLELLAAKQRLVKRGWTDHKDAVSTLRQEYRRLSEEHDKHSHPTLLKLLQTNKKVRVGFNQAEKAGKRLMKLIMAGPKFAMALARAFIFLSIAIGVVGLVAAVAKAVPWVAQLLVELSSLLALALLIPTAIGALVASFATLKMATKGVGQALGAGFGDDYQAYQQAINKLSPAAAKFVSAIVSLKTEFKSLQKSTQEEFFKPLIGVIIPALKSIIPTIGAGATRLARIWGMLFAQLIQWFGGDRGKRFIEAMFQAANVFARTLGDHLLPLLDAFTTLMVAVEPHWDRLMAAMGRGMDKFAAWLVEISENGKLDAWMNTAFEMSKLLIATFEPIVRIIKALAAAGNGGALGFLVMFLDKVADWAESSTGQAQLMSFFDSMDQIVASLAPTLPILGHLLVIVAGILAQILQGGVADAFVVFLQTIADTLAGMTKEDPNYWLKLGEALGGLVEHVAQWVPEIIKAFLWVAKTIADNPWILDVLAIVYLIIQVVGFLVPIIGAIGTIASAAAAIAAALGVTVGAVLAVVGVVLAIVAVVVAIVVLLVVYWDEITNWFTNTLPDWWNNTAWPSVEGVLQDIGEGFLWLYHQVADAITNFFNMLGDWWHNSEWSPASGWDKSNWNPMNWFRFAGGEVAGGSTYITNELGPEKFMSASGKISDIGDGSMGKWMAPSSGWVLPASVSARLDEAMAAAGARGYDGAVQMPVQGAPEYNEFHMHATINHPATELDVDQALRKAWKKMERERVERR